MPFEDAACHVWAIDGYEDDTQSGKGHRAFIQITDGMVRGGSSSRLKKLKLDPDTIVPRSQSDTGTLVD